MKKIIMMLLILAFSANADVKQISISEVRGAGEHNTIIEKICVDGYFFVNVYQKRPLMTIEFGRQTALTAYPVLISSVQLFEKKDGKSVPAKC